MTFDSYQHQGLEALDTNGPRLLFAEHHRQLQRAATTLIARAYEDNCHSLVAEYRAFERHVLEHMCAEEELILPYFERENPAEAAAIRVEHSDLRRLLECTALDVELHAVRVGALRKLIAELERHAAREDRLMYPWAQVNLPRKEARAGWERLVSSIRELGRSFVSSRDADSRDFSEQ